MKKVLLALLVLAIISPSVSYAGGGKVKVCIGRPVSTHVVVVKPNKPGSNFVWIDGHYDWNPLLNRYVWVEGHWRRI